MATNQPNRHVVLLKDTLSTWSSKLSHLILGASSLPGPGVSTEQAAACVAHALQHRRPLHQAILMPPVLLALQCVLAQPKYDQPATYQSSPAFQCHIVFKEGNTAPAVPAEPLSEVHARHCVEGHLGNKQLLGPSSLSYVFFSNLKARRRKGGSPTSQHQPAAPAQTFATFASAGAEGTARPGRNHTS